MPESADRSKIARRFAIRRAVALAVIYLLVVGSGSLGFWLAAIGDTLGALLHPDRSGALANRDFVNYWFAAKLTLAGEHRLLFQPQAYYEALNALFGREMELRSWSYPPHALLFLWPLGFLPYPLAFLVFSALGLALYLFGLSRFLAASPVGGDRGVALQVAVLVLPYVSTQLAVGQNGFWFAGIILLALALRDTRPWTSGLLIGLLSLKPQLAVLLPVLLLVERRWTVIFSAALATLALVAAATALFGFESFRLFATVTLANQKAVMIEWVGIFLRLMPTPFAFLRVAGIDAALAVEINLVFSAAMAIVAIWCIARATSDFRRSLAFLAASALVSPYFFFYDMGALIGAAAIVAILHATRPGGLSFAVFLIATLVCFLPWIMPVLSTAPVLSGLLPALPFAALSAFFLATIPRRISFRKEAP